MLKAYRIVDEDLEEVSDELTPETICRVQWIDLSGCSPEDKKHIERLLDIELDQINQYEPFQVSSHFKASKQQITMTGLLLMIDESGDPHLAKITFIRAKNKLITVSNGVTKGLTSLIHECENCFGNRSDRDDIFAAILDMIVDHTDNILTRSGTISSTPTILSFSIIRAGKSGGCCEPRHASEIGNSRTFSPVSGQPAKR